MRKIWAGGKVEERTNEGMNGEKKEEGKDLGKGEKELEKKK